MLNLNFNPNKFDLNSIKNWLEQEMNDTGNSFINNWSSIVESFNSDKFITINKNNFPIGFMTYEINNSIASFKIASIKLNFRSQNIGSFFINEIFQFLRAKDVLAVSLFCSPESSAKFWKKVGFNYFPKQLNDNAINMYIALIETLKTAKSNNFKPIIKLWDCEPYQARTKEPHKVWCLEFLEDNKTFKDPLIFPVSSDWKIELVKSDNNRITEKIKYLDGDILYSNNILIIKSLK